MFKFLDDVASSVGNFFSVDSGVTPETPMSSPDAIKTGTALSDLGFFGSNGESEFSLPNSVKAFQESNGLKVDGVITPGGPTENAISNALQQSSISTTNPMESSTSALPNNVTVTQPTSSKPDQKSFTASASFDPKPKSPAKPKIDPLTGTVDPLANTPKPNKSMKKAWNDYYKTQEKKAQTTQQALLELMKDPRYQKKDEAYVNHVQKQFKRAYPGEVQYDETGKMIQAKAVIGPDYVQSFNQAQNQQWDQENPERTWDPEQEQRDRKAYAENNPTESLTYDEMQQLLERDPEAFNKLPQSDRSAYHAYMKKKHINRRPDQKPHEREEIERNAKTAGREAGAGSYLGEAVSEPILKATAELNAGFDLLKGEEPDYMAFDEKIKDIQERIPEGYRNSQTTNNMNKIGEGVTRVAGALPILTPLSSLQNGGDTARTLAKAGVSLKGQRIGAAITGFANLFGKGLTKGALKKVNDLIVQKYGTDLQKLAPDQLKKIADTALGEAYSIGPKGIVLKKVGNN